jgi:antitoxin VapB
MGLNIKNQETYRLIQDLADLTGETMTTAVTKAVRERLERVRCAQGGGLTERLVKIGKDCAAHIRQPFKSIDHGDLLCDQRGLPR